MATGGTGDILTGMVAGMIGQEKGRRIPERSARSLCGSVSAWTRRRRDARDRGGAFAGGDRSAARNAGRVRTGAAERDIGKQRYLLGRVAFSFCRDAACCVLPTASALPAETLQATSLREVILLAGGLVFLPPPNGARHRGSPLRLRSCQAMRGHLLSRRQELPLADTLVHHRMVRGWVSR